MDAHEAGVPAIFSLFFAFCIEIHPDAALFVYVGATDRDRNWKDGNIHQDQVAH